MPNIKRFSPNWSDPRSLENITVAREDLISKSVDAIRQSAFTKNKHHLLFVGPRGSGKTHLVTLVHHRISAMSDVMPQLRIAWLNEDETSDTLLSLLLRVHRALSKEYPDEFPAVSTEAIYDLQDSQQATDAMTELLLNQLEKNTLLILMENLDALFRDFAKGEEKKWRALIQNHPRFCTISTAQRLFKEVSDQDEPFFGFFEVNHLKPFSVDDAAELLDKMAEEKNDLKLSEFINTGRGRARIRALHHLTGGNQRLFIILSEFMDCAKLEELVTPFEELVDEQLTPYYQERLRWLPTQQRRIVEYLCTTSSPQAVKVISRHLFATSQSISSQLVELRKMGYLKSKKRGRESLYELAEPLMRLSHQVKEVRGHSPLRLLIDFLRVWYDKKQLTIFHEKATSPISRNYFQLALTLYEAEGINPTSCNQEELNTLRDLAEESRESLRWGIYGTALFGKNRLQEAIKAFNKAISTTDATEGVIAVALINRGNIYSLSGDTAKAIEDYNSVIHMSKVPEKYIAMAVYNRGNAYRLTGKVSNAIEDYTFSISADKAPADVIIDALFNRGLTYGYIGDFTIAIEDFTAIINDDTAPVNMIALAHCWLSLTLMQQGNWSLAYKHIHLGLHKGEASHHGCSLFAKNVIQFLLTSGQGGYDNWQSKLNRLLLVFSEVDSLQLIGTGLVDSALALSHTSLSPEGIVRWHALWQEAAEEHEELILPARLLGVAVKYFNQEKDETALLDLPIEERRILQQALGLEEG